MTVKPMFLCLLSKEISILTLILLSTSQTFVLASTEVNNTVTYENREYGFAFDYPSTWHNEYDANEAQLNNVVIALADPFSNDTQGFEQTSFHVNASDVRRSLGNDLQIKSNTAEDYIRNRINQENESLFQTNAGIKEATDFAESDKLLFTLEYHKNSTTSVGVLR